MNLLDVYHTIRGQVLRAVVKRLDDTGSEQTVDLVAHAGQERRNIPVHHPFGFSSHVPIDGAVAHVVQNGGDPADLVALAPSNPSAARFGHLNEGESVLYDSTGQRVHLRDGQIVEIDCTQSVVVKIAGRPVFTVNQDGVSVTGKITATEDVFAGSVSLKNHVHGGVQSGGGTTQKPQ